MECSRRTLGASDVAVQCLQEQESATKSSYPYLLDVQSELLSELQTRVVAPLARVTVLRKKPITDLTPMLEIEGVSYFVLVPQLAGISKSELGAPVAIVAKHREEIIAAIDLLITGI